MQVSDLCEFAQYRFLLPRQSAMSVTTNESIMRRVLQSYRPHKKLLGLTHLLLHLPGIKGSSLFLTRGPCSVFDAVVVEILLRKSFRVCGLLAELFPQQCIIFVLLMCFCLHSRQCVTPKFNLHAHLYFIGVDMRCTRGSINRVIAPSNGIPAPISFLLCRLRTKAPHQGLVIPLSLCHLFQDLVIFWIGAAAPALKKSAGLEIVLL
mmetsp:Transcript_57244/g.105247  ORF Transcript_57244/g.105247 Transcript_57244/m.105247 type:complete len:207 (-) Transcript_57244:2959-3579(-)